MRRAGGLLATFLCGLSCSPAAAPESARVRAAPISRRPEGPRERLVEALRAIERPAPVLAALPEALAERLRVRLASLDAERKLAVHAEDGAVADSLPLLHLLSGGASPRALYALATTSTGSQELLDAAGSLSEVALVPIARTLSQRAALHFLRDRAADVVQGGKPSALVARLVARAAEAVQRRDLTLLARELLVQVEPSPENSLELARELARAGDVKGAEQRLLEARSGRGRLPSAQALTLVERLIAGARVAQRSAPDSSDVATVVPQARALLLLGRVAEARQALDRLSASALLRLDVSAALAESATPTPSCPDLPPEVGTPGLCASAFASNPQLKVGRELLVSAWQSGTGRDDEAVEVYAALGFVVPWLHTTAFQLTHGAVDAQQALARVGELVSALRELTEASPRLRGLDSFLEAMQSGPDSSGAALRGEDAATALAARARSLASLPASRFAQAGVLAVAATLSHQRDVAMLVDAIPAEQVVSTLRVPRAALELWLAASSGAPERMAEARGELAAIMSGAHGGAMERARLVLGVSEADALLAPSDRAYQLLSRVAGQLLADDVPPDLALRAVLDASGALARGKRYEQAARILAGASKAEMPQDLGRARDALQLVRGYELVLRARDRAAVDLPPLLAAFVTEAKLAGGEAARIWFELWTAELQAREHEARCRQRKPCAEATRVRRDARRGLAARLGDTANAVLARGALPVGSFDAGFRFTIENGLEPLIAFDPQFLALELPPLSNP